MNIYLTEPGMILRKNGGKYVIEKEKEILKEIPQNLVETISVYSGATITSKCISNVIQNNIYVFWFNNLNLLNGYIENLNSIKSEIEFNQYEFLSNYEERLELSKKVISAKLSNGIIVLKRFNRIKSDVGIENNIKNIKMYIKDIEKQKTILNLFGIEGIGSKEYFAGIERLIEKEFMFNERTKRYAKDPMNSLLNFGYSILYSEIISVIKQEHLSPFCGFIHSIRNGHASLASDLMEPFRYQIVDSIAIQELRNKKSILDGFTLDTSTGNIYLDNEFRKEYIGKIIKKLNSTHKYMGKEETYRDTIRNNVRQYKHIINTKNIEYYEPLRLK